MKRCLSCGNTFNATQWTCPGCGYAPQYLDGFASFAPTLSGHVESYDAGRHAAVAAVERRHFWFRGRNEIIVSVLRRCFPHARSLLEVGCGTGQVLDSIRISNTSMRLVGTEVHVAGLALSQQRLSGVELLQMDARAIPFAEEFDVVCAFDVIEHLDDDVQVLEQMRRSCRPRGGILITVPQHRWLWSYRDEFAYHKRRYTRSELKEKVSRAGFRVMFATSFVSLLLPLLYLSRLRQRSAAEFDPEGELEVSPALNQICLSLIRLENFAIRCGVSLPAGGSLLLAAQRL